MGSANVRGGSRIRGKGNSSAWSIAGVVHLAEKNRSSLHMATLCSTLENVWAGAPLVVLYMVLLHLVEGNLSVGAAIGWSFGLLACGVLQAVCSVVAYVQAGVFSFALGEDLRLRLGEHLRKIPLGVLQNEHAGNKLEALLLDVSNIENTLVHMYGKFMGCLVPSLLISIGMLWVDASLGVWLIGTVPAAFLYLYVIRRRIDRRGEAMLQARRDATAGLVEYVEGIKTIRSFNLTGSSFAGLEHSLRNLVQRSIAMEAGVLPLVEVFGAVVSLGMIPLIVLGAEGYRTGELSLSVVLLFLVVSLRFYSPVTGIVGYFSLLRYLSRSVERIRGVLEVPEQSPITEKGASTHDATWKSVMGEGPFDVRFERVRFSYPGVALEAPEGGREGAKPAANEILKGINFHLPAGQTFALVGPSGAGKSTVINLLARFRDVDGGRILIGGKDTAATAPDILLSGLALVLQDVHFFTGSVADNLRLAKPDATDEELMAAAALARCDEVIRSLPQGLHTPLGGAGTRLSGGERRRLAVARAILKNAPIVVLDEATASLDPENEYRMQAAFEKLADGKTLLVVAHRLSTIVNANKILFLEKGQILEEGTYEELLVKNGRFAAFQRLQQQAGGWRIRR